MILPLFYSIVTDSVIEFLDDSEQTTQEGSTNFSHHSGESKDGNKVKQYVKEVTEHACKQHRIERESCNKMLEDNSASCSLWHVRCKVSWKFDP